MLVKPISEMSMKGKVSVAIVILGFVLIGPKSYAQQEIQILESSFDFGKVKEEGGEISHKFQFVNTRDTEVSITSVTSSCGCTTPDWSGDAILAGDTGFVMVQYDPFNRPGSFTKDLRVSFQLAGQSKMEEVLTIKGEVLPKPRTVFDDLTAEIGGIRLKYKSLNIGRITTEKPITLNFDVYNGLDNVVTWLETKSKLPKHIKVSFEPIVLEPNQLGKIILTYDPLVKDDYGYVSDNITIYTDETEDAEKQLSAIATITEYFPVMSDKELAKAPKVNVDQGQFDFGILKIGALATTEFQVTNTGLTDLVIRRIKTNCSCVVADIPQKSIKSGETVSLKVSFDTDERKGRQYKTISIFSNDPLNSAKM
ncbi:MAG: hypothetical protein ACI8WP_001712, partial [Flavobacteriaceae bacterium]